MIFILNFLSLDPNVQSASMSFLYSIDVLITTVIYFFPKFLEAHRNHWEVIERNKRRERNDSIMEERSKFEFVSSLDQQSAVCVESSERESSCRISDLEEMVSVDVKAKSKNSCTQDEYIGLWKVLISDSESQDQGGKDERLGAQRIRFGPNLLAFKAKQPINCHILSPILMILPISILDGS